MLSALVFLIALYRPSSIFVIATFAFSGYVVAAPAMIGSLIWKRASKPGALASLIIPGILIPVYQFTPILNWSTFGFLYNIPVLLLSVALFIGVSLLTSSPGKEYTDKYFQILDRVYRRR